MVDNHNAHDADSGDYSDVSRWTSIGGICAHSLRKRFRFDRNGRFWHEWRDGTHWVEIRDTKIITDILHTDRLSIASSLDYPGMHELRDLLLDDSAWRRETSRQPG